MVYIRDISRNENNDETENDKSQEDKNKMFLISLR
jgi:hypothetical protein